MLLGNYSVLNKNPGRAFGGSTVSGTRPESAKSGPARARFTGWASWPATNSTPTGYRPPYSWVLPIASGEISTFTIINGAGDLSSLLAGGRNGDIEIAAAGTMTGVGKLVTSGAVTMSGTSSASGTIIAVLSMGVTMAGGSTAVADLDGVGFMVAALAGTATLTASPLARGVMAAHIDISAVGDTLTADQVASAVWSTAAATGAPGSMGEAVNVAHLLLRNKRSEERRVGKECRSRWSPYH